MRLLYLVLSVALLFCSGCSLTRAGIASLRSTSNFIALSADPRVRYEPGAESLARQVAAQLPVAIATVERAQFLPFAEPVLVYVCASQGSFERMTGQLGVRATVTRKLFLSGTLKNEPKQVPLILIHELSHLHIVQRIGTYRMSADLPPWFIEGLAVMVSGGGGAAGVTEAQGGRAILDGRSMAPETTGGILSRRYGSAFGLEPQMFYRQGAMFVKYLKSFDPEGFERLLRNLLAEQSFEEAFDEAYRLPIGDTWRGFMVQLRETYDRPPRMEGTGRGVRLAHLLMASATPVTESPIPARAPTPSFSPKMKKANREVTGGTR